MAIVNRLTTIRWNRPRKPVSKITDRAKRYRAHAPDVRPVGPKQCGYCGGRRSIDIDHINGRENDGARENLMWACRSCNVKKANVLRGARLGRLTRQYNSPARSRKAMMDEYAAAIKVMRGVYDGDVGRAVSVIRSTPPDVRSAYTRRTWSTRKAIYGPAGRAGGQSEIPF